MISVPVLWALVVTAVWFLALIVLHIGGLRSGRANAQWLVASFAICFAGDLVTTVVVLLWQGRSGNIVLALIIAAVTSACFFVLYAPALYTILTSVSVATMLQLLRNDGRLPEAELYRQFASGTMLAQRLEVLVDNGYLGRDGTGVRLTSRGRVMARTFGVLKEFWRLGPGG